MSLGLKALKIVLRRVLKWLKPETVVAIGEEMGIRQERKDQDLLRIPAVTTEAPMNEVATTEGRMNGVEEAVDVGVEAAGARAVVVKAAVVVAKVVVVVKAEVAVVKAEAIVAAAMVAVRAAVVVVAVKAAVVVVALAKKTIQIILGKKRVVETSY